MINNNLIEYLMIDDISRASESEGSSESLVGRHEQFSGAPENDLVEEEQESHSSLFDVTNLFFWLIFS